LVLQYFIFIPIHSALIFFYVIFFFFTTTATTEIYTLSLHDALPIFHGFGLWGLPATRQQGPVEYNRRVGRWLGKGPLAYSTASQDRKSTRLNSSHVSISYAVFCLKKKKKKKNKKLVDNTTLL